MAMGQYAGSQTLPGLKQNLKGSMLEPFVNAATESAGAFGPGTLGGISSILFSGDPKTKGFSGRVARIQPNQEFLKSIGLESLPTSSEALDDEMAMTGTPPSQIVTNKPPIAGGPTYQDPTLVDPRDPAVINRIQSGIDVRNITKNLQDGQGVRFNEKTGKYEADPRFVDPSVAEEEKGIVGEIAKGDITEKKDLSPGRLQAEFGSPLGKKEIIKPDPNVVAPTTEDKEDKKDTDKKDDIVEPKATTKEDVEKLINSGSPEEQQSELKQLMSEFKQNAPEYEGIDKNLALAKVFFSIAAGKSPDAITNIASGLEKGADVFIKDKEKRNAFNRQIDLAALKHGLVERSKDRKLKYFIADKELTIDGKKYDKGSVVDLSEGFIRKNGIPSGLTTETLTKAALDNAASVKKTLAKLQKEKILAPKDFNTFSKRIDDAALNFTKSRNLQTLIQGQIFNISEGNITGGVNAGKALVKKAFNFANIKTDKKYSTIEEYNTDMQKVANTLIQQILGEGSKNLSNVDRQLAQEIVGLYTTGGKSVTGYAFVSDDILLKRLQGIHDKVQLTQQSSLAEIEDVLAATNGLTFQSGQAVKFSKVRNLGLYAQPQGGTQGGKTQTIKLGTLLTDGKFDKNKFNKALLG